MHTLVSAAIDTHEDQGAVGAKQHVEERPVGAEAGRLRPSAPQHYHHACATHTTIVHREGARAHARAAGSWPAAAPAARRAPATAPRGPPRTAAAPSEPGGSPLLHVGTPHHGSNDPRQYNMYQPTKVHTISQPPKRKLLKQQQVLTKRMKYVWQDRTAKSCYKIISKSLSGKNIVKIIDRRYLQLIYFACFIINVIEQGEKI